MQSPQSQAVFQPYIGLGLPADWCNLQPSPRKQKVRPTKRPTLSEATANLRPEGPNSTTQPKGTTPLATGPRFVDSAASDLAQLYRWYKQEGLIFPEPFLPGNHSQDRKLGAFLRCEPFRMWHTVTIFAGRRFLSQLSCGIWSQHTCIRKRVASLNQTLRRCRTVK